MNSMMQMSQNLKLQNLNANFNNNSNLSTPNQYQYYMMVNDTTSPMINKKNMSSGQVPNFSHNNIPNNGTFSNKNSFGNNLNENEKEDKKSNLPGNMSVHSHNVGSNLNNNCGSNNNNGNVTNNGKYTCRFEIQIENDKEFQVARRLIGAKVNNSLNNLLNKIRAVT